MRLIPGIKCFIVWAIKWSQSVYPAPGNHLPGDRNENRNRSTKWMVSRPRNHQHTLSVSKTHPPPSGEFSGPTGRYQARRLLRRLMQNPLDLSGQGSVTVR